MISLTELETSISELATAANSLTSRCQGFDTFIDYDADKTPQPLIPGEAANEARRARRSILSNIFKIQRLLIEPTDFLQQLAIQNQLLACVQWLGESQVLACIPSRGSVPLNDVSDLAGIPVTQLSRVVRMTVAAGFLLEPHPGHIAHSTLSAPFVTKPPYLDALLFLARTATPAALQMPAATQRFGDSQSSNESAYNVAFDTSTPFASVCEQQPKLLRQWLAYLRHGTGEVYDALLDILAACLASLYPGKTIVVEVGARSPDLAVSLSKLFPELQFIVQTNGPGADILSGPTNEVQHQLNSRITVQQRVQGPGTPQIVHDAAVYILHLPPPLPGIPIGSTTTQIAAELRVHLDVLRSNRSATLILVARILPEPGTVGPDVEALACLRDLSLLQLANVREMEMFELMDMLNSVSDGIGRLALVNQRRSPCNGAIALEVRYKACAGR